MNEPHIKDLIEQPVDTAAGAFVEHERQLAMKRKYNKKLREKYRSQGLTSTGKPFKRPPKTLAQSHRCDRCGKAFGSAPALRMHTLRKHTKGWDTGSNFRKKQLLNGASVPLVQSDNMGEAARAIIVAAQVLRSVGIGLKL